LEESCLVTSTVDALIHEYTSRYVAHDTEGVVELCVVPFLAIRGGAPIHLAEGVGWQPAGLGESQEAGHQPGLLRIHRQLRSARRGESDEVQPLQSEGDSQARQPQRHTILPMQLVGFEERQCRTEAGCPQDRVELSRRAIGEVDDLSVDSRDGRYHVDAAVLDPVQKVVVHHGRLVVEVAGHRGRQAAVCLGATDDDPRHREK
jgi:hypothetical protein